MLGSRFFFAITLVFASRFFASRVRTTAAIGTYALTSMFRSRFFFAITLVFASRFFAI